MRVRMRVEVSGTHNGVRWPARGGVVELDDTEGAALCASGMAAPVSDEPVETATVVDPVETRQDPRPPVQAPAEPKPAKKSQGRKA